MAGRFLLIAFAAVCFTKSVSTIETCRGGQCVAGKHTLLDGTCVCCLSCSLRYNRLNGSVACALSVKDCGACSPGFTSVELLNGEAKCVSLPKSTPPFILPNKNDSVNDSTGIIIAGVAMAIIICLVLAIGYCLLIYRPKRRAGILDSSIESGHSDTSDSGFSGGENSRKNSGREAVEGLEPAPVVQETNAIVVDHNKIENENQKAIPIDENEINGNETFRILNEQNNNVVAPSAPPPPPDNEECSEKFPNGHHVEDNDGQSLNSYSEDTTSPNTDSNEFNYSNGYEQRSPNNAQVSVFVNFDVKVQTQRQKCNI